MSGSTVRLEVQLLSRLLRWAAVEKRIECKDVVAGQDLTGQAYGMSYAESEDAGKLPAEFERKLNSII